jgi:hypothetical protein
VKNQEEGNNTSKKEGGKEECQHSRISVMPDKAVSYREIKGEQMNAILLYAGTVCALNSLPLSVIINFLGLLP